MKIEGQRGTQDLGSASFGPLRLAPDGSLATRNTSGRYYDAVQRGNVYSAANQTGCVWSVGLHKTNTGLCLSNPVGSGKNLSILYASHQEVVAPTGIAAVYLAGGYSATAVTHTTPGTIYRMNLSATSSSTVAKFDTGATLPDDPVILMNLTAGHTSGALSTSACLACVDIGGLIVVEPGGFLIVANFTIGVAVGQMAALVWEEVDI